VSVFRGASRFLKSWFSGSMSSTQVEALDLAADDQDIRQLIFFMSEVGAAMNGAGDATTFIRRSLKRIGSSHRLPNVDVFVVPTLLLLRYGDRQSAFVDLSSQIPNDLRLNQVAALYELIEEAEAGKVTPAEGLARLRWLLALPPRHSTLLRIAAVSLIAVGVQLSLSPSPAELLWAGLLGLGIGALREVARGWPQVWPLLPAFAGLVVGVISLTIVKEGAAALPLQILVPSLITFLPGATLTVSMIELANGDIVAGGSRLAYGTMRLFLLFFGVFVAAQWVGLPEQAPETNAIPYSQYLPLIGLTLFTLGVHLHFSGPEGAMPWLLLVIAAAWLGQQAGSLVLGGPLDGFAGGVAMIFAARLIEGKPGAPPLLVSFTPAFWFLVPGALGLEGLTNLLTNTPSSGIDDILAMVTTMIGIALGILFGLILAGSTRARDPVN
jgi:uncharacterized membrane protein YjjP (DUF1212 family)